MVSFSLVWRLPVAAVLLLASLACFGDEQAAGADVGPVASDAPAAAPESPSATDQGATGPSPADGGTPTTPAAQPESGQNGGGDAAKKDDQATDNKNAAGPNTRGKGSSPDLPVPNQNDLNTSGIPDLKQSKMGFGYDVFGTRTTLIADGPIDDNYIVSPGDEIVVTIWGEMS